MEIISQNGKLTIVAAGEDGKGELRNIVVGFGCRLGPADGALLVRVADGELVAVLGEGLQTLGLDLWQSSLVMPPSLWVLFVLLY